VKGDLIYCSITGFGQDGPRREQAAYDFMIQGMSGLMSVTGEADGKPGGGPQKVGVPIVDIMTGMYAVIAVLAALARRNASGQGEHIDIGMLDVGVSFLANQAMNSLLSGKPAQRSGNAHPNIQPQDVFRARDGYLVLAVGNDDQFVRFCDVLERGDLAKDERFKTNAGRVRNNAILTPLLTEILATRDREHWVSGCERVGVPCGPINTIPEAFADPQVVHRKMLIEIAHAVAGKVPQVASPMRFKNSALSHDRPPPLLGEHSEEILRELGWQASAQKANSE
jgi:crotonobetainyl-CoA:carnitine CoA-transferase CaiB-like acyl-CoA transferase